MCEGPRARKWWNRDLSVGPSNIKLHSMQLLPLKVKGNPKQSDGNYILCLLILK